MKLFEIERWMKKPRGGVEEISTREQPDRNPATSKCLETQSQSSSPIASFCPTGHLHHKPASTLPHDGRISTRRKQRSARISPPAEYHNNNTHIVRCFPVLFAKVYSIAICDLLGAVNFPNNSLVAQGHFRKQTTRRDREDQEAQKVSSSQDSIPWTSI